MKHKKKRYKAWCYSCLVPGGKKCNCSKITTLTYSLKTNKTWSYVVNYLNIEDIVADKRFPFSKGQLRMFLLHRDRNGLQNVVRKIGRRLYFREDMFIEWIESHGERE